MELVIFFILHLNKQNYRSLRNYSTQLINLPTPILWTNFQGKGRKGTLSHRTIAGDKVKILITEKIQKENNL